MAQRNWSFLEYATEKAAVQSDKELPANCFTLGRFGVPREGIELSLNPGQDAFRPWQPHIVVGGWRVHRDRHEGCVFEKRPDGKTAVMRRAVVHTVALDGTRTFHTLKKPSFDTVGGSSILKLRFGMEGTKRVVVQGRDLRPYAGVDGGTLLERDSLEAVVVVKEGERINIFYEDGGVRSFLRQGAQLIEATLRPEEMLRKRIEHAHARFAVLLQDPRPEVSKMVYGLLAGMTDLFYFTTLVKDGQQLRMVLVREFFLRLPEEAYRTIIGKLRAVVESTDHVLAPMLYRSSYSNVVDINTAASKQVVATPQEREARREANIAKAEADKAAKEARQARFRAERKAKTATAPKEQKNKNKSKNKAKAEKEKKAA